MHEDIQELRNQLLQSKARWKIVFGHHPLYTQGKSHGVVAECLRLKEYNNNSNCKHDRYACAAAINMHTSTSPGYGLEEVLIEGGVHAYIAGHEHVLQYHNAHNIHHVGCGATGGDMDHERRGGFYGGISDQISLDWVGDPMTLGFVSIDITYTHMNIQYLDTQLNILKDIYSAHPSIGVV